MILTQLQKDIKALLYNFETVENFEGKYKQTRTLKMTLNALIENCFKCTILRFIQYVISSCYYLNQTYKENCFCYKID